MRQMTPSLDVVVVPVRDLAAAKALYTVLLGTPPSVDSEWYVGFDVAGRHVGLDPNGHAAGMAGPVGFWRVPDIRAACAALVAAGATIRQDVRAVGGSREVATLADADGNPIGLMQDG